MLNIYDLERQATAHARDAQDALLRRERLKQARDGSRGRGPAIQTAVGRWSLPRLAAFWTGEPGATRT